MDVPGPVPIRDIKAALQAKSVDEVPAPYGLAGSITCGIKMDIAIVKQENGNAAILKIVNLSEKVKVARARELCVGKAHMVDWKGEVRTMKKCVHFIFERLGGFQCRNHVFRSLVP